MIHLEHQQGERQGKIHSVEELDWTRVAKRLSSSHGECQGWGWEGGGGDGCVCGGRGGGVL